MRCATLKAPNRFNAYRQNRTRVHTTDLQRNDMDQRDWLAWISDWAEADPVHEKPYIQVAEVFAALAEMQAGKGPGGTREQQK